MPASGDTRPRTPEAVRRWADEGTRLFLDATDGLTERTLDHPSGLPSWTRRHLVAHVAANADALSNLVRWAATGEPTPMYTSPQARAEGIERGLQMSAAHLLTWLREASTSLSSSMSRLTDDQWSRTVTTAQGRTVPASEIPWLRAREVFVHAVDLELNIAFADLPEDFLAALSSDVIAKRGEVPPVEGDLAARVAWLTGRPHTLSAAPDLGPWL